MAGAVSDRRVHIKRRGYRAVKRAVGAVGLDVTRKHFYSPIPSELPPSVWIERSPLRGIAFDLDAQLEWLSQLGPFFAEFQPPVRMTDTYTFRYDNASFGHGDADVLYAMVRHLEPARVLELGSGHSSAVIQYAAKRNASSMEYRVFDPFPTDHLGTLPAAAVGAQDLPEDEITALAKGDILFVDTTHTVKVGCDVVRIILDLFPLLAAGVYVHVHDIFLPYAYPRAFFEEHEYYWAEQYLLQAYLAFNNRIHVLAALHALSRERAPQLSELIPSVASGQPASLWLVTS